MLYTEFPLDDRLQRALADAGFVSPTPIQAEALPVALAGRDLVGTAQTGTGKTAAFVLPILQQLMATPLEERKTRAVILAPTRELVEQILAVVRDLTIHSNIRAVAVYGGVDMFRQTRALRNGVELVVACPGRLLDHINRRNTDFRQLDCLVLDEADRMLDMGFMPSIQEILTHLPENRQTMLFSATFPHKLNAFVKETLSKPVRIEVDTAVAAQTVHHTQYRVKGSMKTAALTALLRKLETESDSVLIFTRTRVTANQLADDLQAMGMRTGVLHAEKTQRMRQDTLDHFRSGYIPYLVATDIAARGIDVASISHVINYDLPAKTDDYIHRIGRTGRMERTGYAISLVTKGDMRALRDIEHMLGKRIEVADFDESELQQARDAMPPRGSQAADGVPHRPAKAHHQDHEDRPHRARNSAMPAETSRRRVETAVRKERQPRISEESQVKATGAERPRKKRINTAPPGAEWTPRERDLDITPKKSEGTRKRFSGERPTGRPERPGRTDRRQRDEATPFAPKRRERTKDHRFADTTTFEAPKRQHRSEKRSGAAASGSQYNRKFNPGKRQSGEVASGSRHGKSGAVPHSAAKPAPRSKRTTRR